MCRVSSGFFLDAGFDPASIFYGLCPESNCEPAPTLEEAVSQVKRHRLAGTHLWRLNSDNYMVEGAMQAAAWDAMHSS